MAAIVDGFIAYDKLVDKEIRYVFLDNGKFKELAFNPQKKNFMHLCGVRYKDFSANRFYKAIKGMVAGTTTTPFVPTDLKVKEDGSTDQKLGVIKYLNDLTTCEKLRLINKKGQYLKCSYDKGIRSNRIIFCLGLQNIGGTFAPTTLLNLKTDKRDTVDPGLPVHCIYAVDHKKKTKQILDRTPYFISEEQKKAYPYIY